MSFTNKTPNFNLPQYIPNDEPTYLADFNQSMLIIDTALKENQTTAENAENSSTLANTIANEAKTQATSAEQKALTADTKATTALNNATTAGTTANNALNLAQNIQQALSLNNITSIKQNQITIKKSDGSIVTPKPDGFSMKIATNQDNTIGKIYGTIVFPMDNPNTKYTVSFASPFRPNSDITINNAGFVTAHNIDDTVQQVDTSTFALTIKTDGTIEFSHGSFGGNQAKSFLLPFLYFITDFGDVNNPL